MVAAVPAAHGATRYRPQITNGTDAATGEHPYMVALLDSGVSDRFAAQFCGGSLIQTGWVLTAAHCVISGEEATLASSIDVLVGSVDLSLDDGRRIAVRTVVPHPAYDDATSANDLALLELDAAATAGPVELADASTALLEAAGTLATLTGWGGLDPDPFDGDPVSQSFPTHLQAATFPIIDDGTCVAELGGFDPLGMLCAGDPDPAGDSGVDACFGDSGGPLVVTDGTRRVQVGIVSFGPGCAFHPSAYTRVSSYTDFIDATIAAGDSSEAGSVIRVAGANRYATAAALATDRFDPGLDAAFVVTGTTFPDALAAAAAASAFGAPILLTERDALPDETAAALATLSPGQIFVVGGPGAVSDAVFAQLDAMAPGGATRIAGASRYDTAAALSQLAFATPVGNDALPVFLASGETFADALSGAAAAASGPATPLLLTPRDGIPDATLTELVRQNPSVVRVLGGTAAVSDGVVAQIEALGFVVERLAGADRYATSATIVAATFDASDEVLAATGANFPDGLVAGALGVPLLLLPPSGIPEVTAAAVTGLDAVVATVFGGTVAVSDEQAALLADLVAS